MLWELLILSTGVAALLSIAVYTLITGMSPMPTLPGERQLLFSLLPTADEMPEGERIIFELGAGWGSLALPLARRYPGQTVAAYERSVLPWLVCRLRKTFAAAHNLRVYRRDFFRADLSSASLVICYLSPGAMGRLRPKLEAEASSDVLVISNGFALPGWDPESVLPAPGWFGGARIYRYRVPVERKAR